jgi:hypothetical protein
MDQLPRRVMADFRDIAMAGAELSVTVGIIEAALYQQDSPEEVKQNFAEKVDDIHTALRRDIEECISFGEAYDGD